MANAMGSGGRKKTLRQWAARGLLLASAPLTLNCAAQNVEDDTALAQGADLPANTTGDIGPSYGSMAGIGFGQTWQGAYATPGNWNDPDMLFMHALQPTEQITHLSLWSLLAAPLLIGSDLSKVTPFTINALSNDEAIDVDQDPLGIQGHRVAKGDDTEVWMRPLWDGTIAVGLFNRSTEAQKVTAKWSDLKIKGSQPVRDLWQKKELGKARDAFMSEGPPHGAILVKIGQPKNVDAYIPTMK